MSEYLLEIWLVSSIVMIGIVILVVTLQLRTILLQLSKDHNAPEDNSSWWATFTGLKPLEKEREIMMAHTYDGIEELDNPTPPWFMYLFYTTILFGAIYAFYYHVYQDGDIQVSEYKADMAVAEKAKEAYMKKFANAVNEKNVVAVTQTKELTEGSEIYVTNCIACHGDKGQGGVGPNLTDKFWIHGGGIKDLFKTITHGVPEKGMIAWNKTLNPLQIQKVASYILTLQGTNPPMAKEPQGVEVP